MNLLLQYYQNVEHPDFAGGEQIRLEAVALWPTGAAKAAREKEKEMAREEKAAKEKAGKEKD